MRAAGARGDFVECGTCRGGSAALLACAMPVGAHLWLYDSFQGLPEPVAQDGPVASKYVGACLASQRDVEAAAAEGNLNYTAVFARVMARIGTHLDAQVVQEVRKALTIMDDGRPCPASQIAVGIFTTAALAMAMIHDMLAGLPVPSAPKLVAHSFRNHITKQIDIGAGG